MDGMNTLRAWNLRGTEPGSGDRELDRGKMGGRAASPQGGTCSLPREGDLFSFLAFGLVGWAASESWVAPE
jgi:hypothetical protein